MHPIHDVDVLLLLATALAAKRRPAELAEIMAAADLLHGSIPLDAELAAAFVRLSVHGLIGEAAGCFRLTPEALQIMGGLGRKKATTEERLLAIRQQLADYAPIAESEAIRLPTEQISAAILAHRIFLKSPGRSMLVPRPKAAMDKQKRPAPWRKPPAGGRSRA